MFTLVAFIVSLAISAICYLLQPQKKTGSNATASTLDDLDVPTATEGDEIPVVFGKRWVDPNCVWFGDFNSVAIRKKSGSSKK